MKTKMIWGQTDFKDVEHSAAHFKYLKILMFFAFLSNIMSSLPAALWPTVFVHLQYFNMFCSHQVKLYYAGTLLCSAVLESVSRVYILFKILFIFLSCFCGKFTSSLWPKPIVHICILCCVFLIKYPVSCVWQCLNQWVLVSASGSAAVCDIWMGLTHHVQSA